MMSVDVMLTKVTVFCFPYNIIISSIMGLVFSPSFSLSLTHAHYFLRLYSHSAYTCTYLLEHSANSTVAASTAAVAAT